MRHDGCEQVRGVAEVLPGITEVWCTHGFRWHVRPVGGPRVDGPSRACSYCGEAVVDPAERRVHARCMARNRAAFAEEAAR